MANTTADALPLLPNPLTPMAFLPPEIAFELTLLKYVFVGTLGVRTTWILCQKLIKALISFLGTVKAVIWDTIMSISVDYHLLRDCKFTLPTIVYFFSRWVPQCI